MEAKGWMMLHTLINRYHQGAKEGFIQALPEKESQGMEAYAVSSDDISPAAASDDFCFGKTHYSWLLPALKSFPGALQPTALRALPDQQAQGLGELMGLSPAAEAPSPPIRQFLLHLLSVHYQDPDFLPPSLLPESDFSSLTVLSKGELVTLIDLLGIHDLAEELRPVVDKAKIKQVFLCLSPRRQSYLKRCLRRQDRLERANLYLDRWHGERRKLNKNLHRLGITRLGKALSGQPKVLIHYLSRVLDTGRGALLIKAYSEAPVPKLQSYLLQQVTAALTFMKTDE